MRTATHKKRKHLVECCQAWNLSKQEESVSTEIALPTDANLALHVQDEGDSQLSEVDYDDYAGEDSDIQWSLFDVYLIIAIG